MPKKRSRLSTVNLSRAAACAAPAMTAAILLAIAGGLVLGSTRLQSLVTVGAPAGPTRVQFDWPPSGDAASSWMGPGIRDGLVLLVERTLADDPAPFSTSALRSAAAALSATGWFEHLEAVERATDGVVRVRGTWRVPAAAVRHRGLDQLVARGGELLPPTYLPGESGQKVILGIEAAPPDLGRPWAPQTRQVAAALELLALIGDRPWRGQIEAIDTSEYPGKRRLEIVTTSGSRIAWGGAPSDAIPGEQPAHYKLRRLDVLADRFGCIDASERFVDVTGPLTLIDKRPAGSP